MAKSTTNLGDMSNKVYGLLHALDDGERAKVLNAVHQLFGESGSVVLLPPGKREVERTILPAHPA